MKVISSVVLPEAVQACVDLIAGGAVAGEEDAALVGLARTGVGGGGISAWRLWKATLQVLRGLLFKAVVISFLASVGGAASSLVAMRILRAHQGTGSLLALSLAYFAISVLGHGAVFRSGRLRAWVGLGGESFLVGLVSCKLLAISSLAASRQLSGHLKTLITSDARNIGQFLDNLVRNVIPALTALVVITPLIARFSGWAGLLGVGVMALILPITIGLNAISSYFQGLSQGELDHLTSLVGEWVKNIRLIRYLSWDQAFREEVSARVRKFMKVSILLHFMACLIFGLSTCWWMVSVTALVVARRRLGFPTDGSGETAFFGSLWLLTFLAGYFMHLPNTVRLYALAGPSMQRLARFLSEPEQADFFANREPDPGPPGTSGELSISARPIRVHFRRVSFQYPGGKKALDELNFTLDLTRKTAIIGEIGSGKTTLLKLLCGELPPTQGTIEIEFDSASGPERGPTRDLWTREGYARLRQALAYVPQEPFVSSDTLGMNITLGDPGATEESGLQAAYWAELEADLQAFPQGMSQEIGESGVNLSGGQRQRLNLARAIYARRDYLVLDDTLSAVDTKTEKALVDQLVGRPGGFVLVTHRTGELMRVEEVMVLREGRIVETGDPRVLISRPDSHFLRVLRAYHSATTAATAATAEEATAAPPAEGAAIPPGEGAHGRS